MLAQRQVFGLGRLLIFLMWPGGVVGRETNWWVSWMYLGCRYMVEIVLINLLMELWW